MIPSLKFAQGRTSRRQPTSQAYYDVPCAWNSALWLPVCRDAGKDGSWMCLMPSSRRHYPRDRVRELVWSDVATESFVQRRMSESGTKHEVPMCTANVG